MLVAVTPWALVAGTPLVVLFTIPLLPVAVAIGVLRHQLLDIRLVVARGVTYALLSGLVLAAYAALVVVLSGVASALVVACSPCRCAVVSRSSSSGCCTANAVTR